MSSLRSMEDNVEDSTQESTDSEDGHVPRPTITRLLKIKTDLVDAIEEWSGEINMSADVRNDLNAIVDRFKDELKEEMIRMQRENLEMECKWKKSEEMRKNESAQLDRIVLEMGLHSPDDIVHMYTQLRASVREKNTVINDLIRHWNADIIDDLFLIPRGSPGQSPSRENEVFESDSNKNNRVESMCSVPDVSNQSENVLQGTLESERVKKKKKRKKNEEKSKSSPDSKERKKKEKDKLRKKKMETKRKKGRKKSSEEESSSDSDSSSDSSSSSSDTDSSSESDKEKRRRRKDEKKDKKKKSSEISDCETERKERKRKKARDKLISKLPRMEPYDGNQERWRIFSNGFKIRYEEFDDRDGVIILREHLCGEASKLFKGLPKEIEKKGLKKSLKWLKERIMGGTMYKMIDYERQLRDQTVNGRRVTDVCDEFTRWIHKLYEKERHREDMKKRQILLLYEGSDEYTRLLEMLDDKASFEEMKIHLERKEYAMRLEFERNERYRNDHEDHYSMEVQKGRMMNDNMRCYGCNEIGHKMNKCPNRVNPSKPDMKVIRCEGIGDEKKFVNGSNDVRFDQRSHYQYNKWEAKDRPSPKKDPEKRVMSVTIHPSMYNEVE